LRERVKSAQGMTSKGHQGPAHGLERAVIRFWKNEKYGGENGKKKHEGPLGAYHRL
jgi:hypothetical protein